VTGNEEGISHQRWQSKDARCCDEGRVLADGGETWGKRNAMTRRSVGRKGSMIGGETQWLAEGRRATAAYLGLGEIS
jgi:hypothetical protein